MHRTAAFDFHAASSALPSESFRATVRAFAQAAGLDEDRLLDGGAVAYKRLAFRFQHHADADPDALYLLLEVGRGSDSLDPRLCQHLLELNAVMPAARCGYYALWPGTDVLLYCVRIDLLDVPEPHLIVAGSLEVLASAQEGALAEWAALHEKAAQAGGLMRGAD